MESSNESEAHTNTSGHFSESLGKMSVSQKSEEAGSMWQMEVLMEKLRSKASSLRSMPESAKLVKQAILNKQHILDQKESIALGQCLDKLQQNIKVTSLPAMIERLEGIARQLGLTFTSGTTGAAEVYISCDMFYVEVLMQSDGQVMNVKVELAGDQIEAKGQVSCPELADCLGKGNFTEFTAHLEGFLSIYQLNTEKKNKCKAYQALQALEVDLFKLFEIAQETVNDTHRLITKSPVGLLVRRRGGFPMKMVYFISPYELLDVTAGRSVSLNYEGAATKDLNYSVSVNTEASTTHKLQTVPLVNVKLGSDGLTLPSIMGLTPANSVSLPACFALKLKNPMPMSLSLARKISEITQIPCYEIGAQQPLIPLVIQKESSSNLDANNNKGLFVTLPDQQHCYFMTNGVELEGVMVHQIPFTHPTSIAKILENLRTQAVFNALISSCVRPASKQEIDSSYVFEVTSMSHEFISVTFEHPQEESTATAELDLTDFSNVKCRLYTLGQDADLCSDEYATKVLQRCLSIPVTMRAVLKKATKEEKKEIPPQGDSVALMGGNSVPSLDNNQNTKFVINDYNPLGGRRDQMMTSQMSMNNVAAAQATPAPRKPFASSPEFTAKPEPIPNQFTNSMDRGPPISYPPLINPLPQKTPFPQHFLGDSKLTKVKKKKYESDKKSAKSLDTVSAERNKLEKGLNSLTKRRLSNDNVLADTGPNDLAALREKVYGAATAANYAKLHGYIQPKDKDKKAKKVRSEGDNRKSPIIFDLTLADTKSGCPATVTSPSFNNNMLKKSGMEIFPIPGSNTPISIPASITVTPVIKSDDRSKDRKDRKDKKDVDRKDKKRRREDSPSAKSSKVQIISTNSKHSTTGDRMKSDSKTSMSGPSMKSSLFHTPPKKPSMSPSLSKSIMQGKMSISPTQKPNKLIYSPSHSSSHLSASPKGTSSPKSCGSPKQPNVSPKHSSIGKPSLNALKSNSPSFSRPNLSPKTNKSTKERGSSCSPSRLSGISGSSTPSGVGSVQSTKKSSSTSGEKVKSNFPDALTITKVASGEVLVNAASSASPSHSGGSSPNMERLSMDKAKASPPKNRKGSSLSDIVDKLRAGACGSGNMLTILERKALDKNAKSSQDGKKDSENFTIKSGTGLKFTINKARNKEGLGTKSSTGSLSVAANSKQPATNKVNSGLKPGVMSGPASKKISMSSFPPIPKLPRSSVSNVTNTAISPLNNSVSLAHSTPLQYQRERPKENKDRLVLPEKIRPKDTVVTKVSDTKKESTDKSTPKLAKEISGKESQENIDDVDRALKNIFGGDHAENRSEEDVNLSRDAYTSVAKNMTESFDVKSQVESKSKHDSSHTNDQPPINRSLVVDNSNVTMSTNVRTMPPPAVPSNQSKIHEKENISTPSEDKMKKDTTQSTSLANHCIPQKRAISPPMSYPPSPTLSIKIVKSPAPVTSPLNLISPQSVSLQHSPCIIDDDLMDEALMGSRK